MDVIEIPADAMLTRGIPEHARSDSDAEITANIMHDWLDRLGVKTPLIVPDSPWEDGYCESFDDKLCDELLNGELFYSLKGAQVVIEQWCQYYNT